MKSYHIKNKEIIPERRLLKGRFVAAITALLLLSSPAAFAHKLNIFAYAEGNEIFAEGYFTDGKKAKNGEVTVFDGDGNELLRGTTDLDGQFTFAIPKQSDLRITINAGMGHQAAFVVRKEELSDESSEAIINTATSATESTVESGATETSSTPVATTPAIDNNQLRSEIERAVGKAIKPLMRELSALRAEKSLADIIGGIGFIFGLFGIAMYFKARKQ